MMCRREECLLMTSAKDLLSLVDKTEDNIKLIEQVSSTFISPVLNEWRYAVRHVLTAFVNGDQSGVDAQKAESHLKRAYFDSCDIILDCQLDTLSKIHKKCLGYAETVRSVVPDYPAWLEAMRDAQRLHREAQKKHDSERVSAFDSLTPTIQNLDGILDKMSFHAEEIAAAVRRARTNTWLTTIAKGAGIIVAAMAILKAIWVVIGRIFA